jgi:hypothetical protein
MEDMAVKMMFVLFLIVAVAMTGLLLAFPIMWAWNYSLVPVLGLPTITWGQAWCLNFLAHMLLKSSLYSVKR